MGLFWLYATKLQRRFVRRLTRFLPKALRFAIYRRWVRLSYTVPSDIVFKIAQTKSELESAFRLLHDTYVESGLMEPHPSGMRLTPYHALPSTTTLIACKGPDVIATVSIIRNSPMGLPLEKIFDLGDQVSHRAKTVEISSLAVARQYRRQHGAILFPLIKFLYTYCRDYFDTRQMFIAVNPKHADLYEALLLFQPLRKDTVAHYSYVKGAPAVGRFINLSEAYNRFLGVYLDAPLRRNLFAYYMMIKNFSNFQFPERTFFKVEDPVMTPELLNYFFRERSDVFQSLTADQQNILHAAYLNTQAYTDVLPEGHSLSSRRSPEPRFDVKCQGVLKIKGTQRTMDVEVTRASFGGFKADLKEFVQLHAVVEMKIRVSQHLVASVEAILVKRNSLTHGFKILRPDTAWEDFVAYLKSDRNRSHMLEN